MCQKRISFDSLTELVTCGAIKILLDGHKVKTITNALKLRNCFSRLKNTLESPLDEMHSD